MLSTKTKKWATYGRKKARIVDVRPLREENKENDSPARVPSPAHESDSSLEPVKKPATVKKTRKALKQRNSSDSEASAQENAYVPLSNTPVKQLTRRPRRKALQVPVDDVQESDQLEAPLRTRRSRRTSVLSASSNAHVEEISIPVALEASTRRLTRRSSVLSASIDVQTLADAETQKEPFVQAESDEPLCEAVAANLSASTAPTRRSRRISALPLSSNAIAEASIPLEDSRPTHPAKRSSHRTSTLQPATVVLPDDLEPSAPRRLSKRKSTTTSSNTQPLRVRPSAHPSPLKASAEIIYTGRSPAKQRQSKSSSSSGDIEILTRSKSTPLPVPASLPAEVDDDSIENIFSPDLSINHSPAKPCRGRRKKSVAVNVDERKARRQKKLPLPRESIVLGSSSEDEVQVEERPQIMAARNMSTPGRQASVTLLASPNRASGSSTLTSTPITPPRKASSIPLPRSAESSTTTKSESLVLPALSKTAYSPLVQPLLVACSQTKPYHFASFVSPSSTHLLSPNLAPHSRSSSNTTWRKLGEATYSEIYVVDSIVCKIVPLLHPQKIFKGLRPEETRWEDGLRELKITNMLDGKGFVELLSAHVVQGVYPAGLLDEWDGFKENEPSKSENVRPSAFTASQLYLILCLPYGGVDLETFRCRDWQQAASILWQVASSLDQAEQTWQFEHRDLHWGNILIERTISPALPTTQLTPLRRSKQTFASRLAADRAGCRARIIDFTLSSVTDGERIQGGMEGDELFEGEGDYQFEVYRMMRTVTQRDWQDHHPVTNLLWLHYLVRKLLHEKGLRKPPPPGSPRPLTPTLPRVLGARRSVGGALRARVLRKELDKFSPEERESHEALRRAEEGLSQLVENALGGEESWKCTGEFLAWWEAVAFM